MIFIICLEEKKKSWEAKKAQRTAERITKAEAWRTELKTRRMEKSSETFVKPVKEIELAKEPMLSKCVEEKRTVRKIKNRKPSNKSKLSKVNKLIKLAKEITPKVKKRVKPMLKLKKVVKSITTKLKPKVKKKAIKLTKRIEQEIVAILKEAKAVKEKTKPKMFVEKKPVEITTVAGAFSDISFPKPKEELDWSHERFEKLEKKLKKLGRF